MYRDFNGTPDDLLLTDYLARLSYHEVGKRQNISPNRLFRSPYCHDLADSMAKLFQRVGFRAVRLVFQQISLAHSHVGFLNDDGTLNPWRIDGDWQQFLPPALDDPTLPKVLIAQRPGIDETLVQFGVKIEDTKIWTDIHPVL